MDRRYIASPKVKSIAGLAAGAIAGVAVAVLAGTAVANRLASSAEAPLIEATHVPPLLTAPNEQIDLRYDVYCLPEDAETDASCNAAGTVFVRSGNAGPFREVSLQDDPAADEGRFVARVPREIAASRTGFSYYAVLRSKESDATVTLPAGGAAAPQQSIPLGRSVDVRLEAHLFGAARNADIRVARAAWGTQAGEVGLEQGRNLAPIGGSAFDVDRNGTVYVLDEANRRLLRWPKGAGAPTDLPLSINGTLADMSIDGEGTIHVLETVNGQGRAPLLRVFDRNGAARDATEVGERASQVRIGPAGPVVLQHPSGQWMAAAIDGRPLTPSDQKRSGRAGRPFPGGSEVVVLSTGNEIRAALVDASGARRTWRVTSETPFAEVQLAEPLGNRLLLVTRVYTDDRDEFLVLILDQSGVRRSFSLDSSDWAETAPLSRFRLAGLSLFQLGSTPAGLFVDRFDLEVK